MGDIVVESFVYRRISSDEDRWHLMDEKGKGSTYAYAQTLLLDEIERLRAYGEFMHQWVLDVEAMPSNPQTYQEWLDYEKFLAARRETS